jgi:hypothetical protein
VAGRRAGDVESDRLLLEPNVPLHDLAGDVVHRLVRCPGGVSQQGESRVEGAIRLYGHHALCLRDARYGPRSVHYLRPHPIDRTRRAVSATSPRFGLAQPFADALFVDARGKTLEGTPIRGLPGPRREGCGVQPKWCSFGGAHGALAEPERIPDHASNPTPVLW